VPDSKNSPYSHIGATKVAARLPGLDIEIIHRRLPEADAERISINLTATPSFEAFGDFLEAANPFTFWLRAMELAWAPWLQAASAVMQPQSAPRPLPSLPRPRRDDSV